MYVSLYRYLGLKQRCFSTFGSRTFGGVVWNLDGVT